jgi:hypothetical protein
MAIEASIAATIGSVMAKILAAPLLLLPVNKRRESLQGTPRRILQEFKEDESAFCRTVLHHEGHMLIISKRSAGERLLLSMVFILHSAESFTSCLREIRNTDVMLV